jgi:hypothetical protein
MSASDKLLTGKADMHYFHLFSITVIPDVNWCEFDEIVRQGAPLNLVRWPIACGLQTRILCSENLLIRFALNFRNYNSV